jgi:outer membrane lipoprotein-sorting protein
VWQSHEALRRSALALESARLQRSGASHRRHTRALLAALWLALPAAGEPRTGESPATLEALMRGMASASGVEARFREEKRLALLSEPIESRGTLYFVPPNRLCRETQEPSVSRLVIDGDRVSFRDAAGGGQAVDLSASPIAREYVANFVVLFGGDLDALRKRYEPHFRADASGWTLELVPRAARLREFITRVTLAGRGRALERMEMIEAGGDRTTTWFEDVRSDRAFSDAELARIFADPPAAK